MLNTFNLPTLKTITSARFILALYIIVLCTQFPAIEGGGVSNVKVIFMAIAPIIFILKTPQINKAVIIGGLLWLCCFFCAYLAGPIRWSTLGYYGMFIMTSICCYSLLRTDEISILWFLNLLKSLILIYGCVLILQQISVITGLTNNPLINLAPPIHHFIKIDKLPLLNLEPSHAARLLAVFMLGYLECYKLINNGEKASIIALFNKQNRYMTLLFLWSMLTMGSGTAYIELCLISIYFITFRNAAYLIPCLLATFCIVSVLDLKQFERAKTAIQVSSTLDAEAIIEEDRSASVRIIPLINLLTQTDLTQTDTWIGEGTMDNKHVIRDRIKDKFDIIRLYGLISYIVMMLYVYKCCIYRFFSIESFIFLLTFGTLGNMAYTWGAIIVLMSLRYFKELYSVDYLHLP